MSSLSDVFALDRIGTMLAMRRRDYIYDVAASLQRVAMELPARHGLTAQETLDVLRATASAARMRDRELDDLLLRRESGT